MRRERGSAIVEFALVSLVFFTLLIAVVSGGVWMYTLEMAVEATRAAARVAVVCSPDSDTPVLNALQNRLAHLNLAAADVNIQRLPADCTATTCTSVRVALNGVSYTAFSALLGSFPVPSFATQLTREAMASVIDTYQNPVCTST